MLHTPSEIIPHHTYVLSITFLSGPNSLLAACQNKGNIDFILTDLFWVMLAGDGWDVEVRAHLFMQLYCAYYSLTYK